MSDAAGWWGDVGAGATSAEHAQMAGRGWRVALVALLAAGCAAGEPAATAEDEPEEEPEANDVSEAAWSPRSDRLLVTWDQGGRSRLVGVLAPDTMTTAYEPGSGLRLTDGPDRHAAWSPDRLWIAFASTRDGQSEIYRMRPDGTGVERLTTDPALDTEPAYSPDGATIAFVSDRTDGTPRLHVMGADGSDVRQVPNPQGGAHAGPEWAPDGTRLVLTVELDGEEVLHVATRTGGWGRLRAGQSASWATDSDQLYYSHGDSVYSMRVSTGTRRPVLPSGRVPTPSPDGRWLAFVRGAYPSSALHVLDLRTGEEHRVTR